MAKVPVPFAVVIVMSTLPATCSGAMTVRLAYVLSLMTAPVSPKKTRVAPSRCVPARTTVVPPAVVPVAGVTEATTGGWARAKTATFGFDVNAEPV